MNASYEDIFAQRGRRYDEAMRRFPSAREEEFEQLLLRANIQGSQTVADVPAGGGYLKAYLPGDCTWLGHEPCAAFTAHSSRSEAQQLVPLPWLDDSVDTIVSLAGVHHIEDKRPLFLETFRVAKPGGRFVLSDVEHGSAVSRFLDSYVGAFNSTGHEGVYLHEGTSDDLSSQGWVVISSEIVNFKWRFRDAASLEGFCNKLFDVREVPEGQTIETASDILGVSRESRHQIAMHWSLRTIVCEKPS